MGDRGIGDRGTTHRGVDSRGTNDRSIDSRGIAPARSEPSHLVAPSESVFADVVVGEVMTQPVWIFNVHPSAEAHLEVRLEVTRDRPDEVAPFQIVSAPTRLRPSREGASEPVIVAFQSQRRADHTGALVAIASWRGSPTPTTNRVEIRLRGWSRAEGESLRADVLAAEAARQAADRLAREKAARAAALQRRYDQETDAPYPQGKVNELERQAGQAEAALEKLCKSQLAAIKVVQGETEKFKRRPPAQAYVLARALASFALDVATAGIAARVAAGVVKAFSSRVSYVRPAAVGERWNVHDRWRYEWTPVEGPPKLVTVSALLSPEGMAALDESVQAAVSGTLAAVGSSIANGSPADQKADQSVAPTAPKAVSGVPDLQFFYQQDEFVAHEQQRRSDALTNFHALLKPSLRREADVAITAMRALVTSLHEEEALAGNIQGSQTRQAWMSFLSQNSVGSLSPAELRRRGLRTIDDTVTVTDVVRIAHATSRGKVPPKDGVLDVYVRASLHRPLEPITIDRLHMNGVIEWLLRKCLQDAGLGDGRDRARFGDLHIALRVIAVASGIEDFGVVVTRDEAGNVFSSDTTGALLRDGNWLARRAGHQRTSPALQQEGAVQFVDEVMGNEVPLTRLSTDAA